jgi:hypothetical protein
MVSRTLGIFSCDCPECDKVGANLCSSCLGVRYCGKACQKKHRVNILKRDCDNTKKKRLEKWNEISVLATAYLHAVDDVTALMDASGVWVKVCESKGHQLPINSLLSKLAKVETVLKSKTSIPMYL